MKSDLQKELKIFFLFLLGFSIIATLVNWALYEVSTDQIGYIALAIILSSYLIWGWHKFFCFVISKRSNSPSSQIEQKEINKQASPNSDVQIFENTREQTTTQIASIKRTSMYPIEINNPKFQTPEYNPPKNINNVVPTYSSRRNSTPNTNATNANDESVRTKECVICSTNVRLSASDDAHQQEKNTFLCAECEKKYKRIPTDPNILRKFEYWPGYPPFWKELAGKIRDRDNGKCQVTGCISRLRLDVHHIVPISEGGTHRDENLITLCQFHHALQPWQGHQSIAEDLHSNYISYVHGHFRRNRLNRGRHEVRQHFRARQSITREDILSIINDYGIKCLECGDGAIEPRILYSKDQVKLTCGACKTQWFGPNMLPEIMGPQIANLLKVTKNERQWRASQSWTNDIGSSWRKIPPCSVCGSKLVPVESNKNDPHPSLWECCKYPNSHSTCRI